MTERVDGAPGGGSRWRRIRAAARALAGMEGSEARSSLGDSLPRAWPDADSYYGRPVLKEPEWTWEVPFYLHLGGIAGVASLLAVAEARTGRPSSARRARRLAVGAMLPCIPLLVADLGRPARFLAMLRLFKPTSAMSVGSWALAGYSGAATAALLADATSRAAPLRPVADAAAGALGVVMATYTGVLVSDTAIPAWHHARRELPILFAAGAAASAAGLLQALHPQPSTRRLVLTAATAELAVERRMTTHLGALGEVYESGDSGRWTKAAQGLTGVGAALTATPSRFAQRVGGALVATGGLCQRWAVYRAGFASAADPRHVIVPQRMRTDAEQPLGASPAPDHPA